MSNQLVSAIIVTAGVNGYLGSCLGSLKAQTYPSLEIIVIDNTIEHNSVSELCRSYPGIRLFSNRKDLLYCEALNKGIAVSSGDFLLCLNDDVILERNFVAEALKGFEIDKKIGMVSGKVLRSDRKTIDSTGLFLSIWRTAKERGYGRQDRGEFESGGYVFGVNGAVAFYRRAMLEQIKKGSSGYFDPAYRIFYEDLDLAWRAQNRGWRGYYIPKAIAYHTRGGTVRQGKGIDKKYARKYLSEERHYDLIKNRYLTIVKNESWFSFFWHLPFIIFYDIFAWGYILFFRPSLIKKFFKKDGDIL
ncbi:MAG: glycosyltransferase family 2 protein [Candidatus Omnitrophota bacterium]